jgi:CBS-domain-containing membrane protein
MAWETIGERATATAATKKRPPTQSRSENGRESGTIERLMRTEVHRVAGDASANDAARLMWDEDIGAVPIVDQGGRLIGIVTDRDVAMAAYLRGQNLWDIPVGSLMTREVVSAHPDDSISEVSALMSRRQVRRVPIVDDQGVLIGIVSINDLALATSVAEPERSITEHEVADALRAICAPRASAVGGQLRAH